jgi:hypothetical protein
MIKLALIARCPALVEHNGEVCAFIPLQHARMSRNFARLSEISASCPHAMYKQSAKRHVLAQPLRSIRDTTDRCNVAGRGDPPRHNFDTSPELAGLR